MLSGICNSALFSLVSKNVFLNYETITLTSMNRSPLIVPLVVLLLFLAAGAFYGSLNLIFSSDGSSLGMDTGWLKNSPFSNFMIPGFILLIFGGLLPLLALAGLLFRPDWNWPRMLNIYSDKHWGWTFTLYTGIIIIIWILIQQVMTSYFILQPVMAMTGLQIIIFSLIPKVMRMYTVK
jgi:hypothetical protein